MKTIRSSIRTSRRLLSGYVLLTSLFLILSCSDGGDSPTPLSNEPIITEQGTPSGELTSKSIGAAGGSFYSADGRLEVTIPPGALSSATTISIQPITNEGPLGMGLAYRLQPEGLTFAVPVSLSFAYTEQMLKGLPEEFLWIITQAGDGSWNALLKSDVDTDSKTVNIETTHFSDWALGKFIDLSLEPSSSTVMKGKSVGLHVAGFARDETMSDDDELVPLVPITTQSDALTPLTPIPPVESRLMDFKVKGWTLNGSSAPVSNSQGKLQANKNTATYTAPNQQPSVNPVAVTVELEATNKEGGKWSYLLTSSISVVESNLYLLVTIDGVTHEYYQYGFNGTIPPDPNDVSVANSGLEEDDYILMVAGSRMKNNVYVDGFGFQLENPTEGTHALTCYLDEGDDDMSFILGTGGGYELDYTKRTTFPDYCDTEELCGAATITLIDDPKGDEGHVRGYFSGTLYEDKPGFGENCQSPIAHTVEGEFWLIRAN